MMGKKSKRLYGRMQHGINKKKDAVLQLLNKRKDLEEKQNQESEKKKRKVGTEKGSKKNKK